MYGAEDIQYLLYSSTNLAPFLLQVVIPAGASHSGLAESYREEMRGTRRIAVEKHVFNSIILP